MRPRGGHVPDGQFHPATLKPVPASEPRVAHSMRWVPCGRNGAAGSARKAAGLTGLCSNG